MVGASFQPARISDLVFAMLEDTGWYNANYDIAEPLAWGNGISINASLIDFPSEPPYSVFLSEYFCEPEDSYKEACSYDLRSYAQCSAASYIYCPSDDPDISKFCNAQEFYNPKGWHQRGSYSIPDFLLYKNTNKKTVCTTP